MRTLSGERTPCVRSSQAHVNASLLDLVGTPAGFRLRYRSKTERVSGDTLTQSAAPPHPGNPNRLAEWHITAK